MMGWVVEKASSSHLQTSGIPWTSKEPGKIVPSSKTEPISKYRFQDELETVPLSPILSISERNLAFMGIKGISRIQLGFVPPRVL
jgi:hypothetical protein